MIRATLSTFARLLRVNPSDADEAIRSERGAKAVLTRRNLFCAAGAMAAGSVFSFPVERAILGWAYWNGKPIAAIVDWKATIELPIPQRTPVFARVASGAKRLDTQVFVNGEPNWFAVREGREIWRDAADTWDDRDWSGFLVEPGTKERCAEIERMARRQRR